MESKEWYILQNKKGKVLYEGSDKKKAMSRMEPSSRGPESKYILTYRIDSPTNATILRHEIYSAAVKDIKPKRIDHNEIILNRPQLEKIVCAEKFSQEQINSLLKEYDNSRTYLKNEFNVFHDMGKRIRIKHYFSKDQFLAAVRWKSPNVIRKAKENSSKDVEEITGIAFSFEFSLEDEKQKIGFLEMLKGVDIPMASSLLAIYQPECYGAIDARAWNALYTMGIVDEPKKKFNFEDWLGYLETIREMRSNLSLNPRDIARALTMYDRLNEKGKVYGG